MSIHGSMWEQAYDELLRDDPLIGNVSIQYLRNLRAGFYPSFWVDAIFQQWGKVDICTAFYFARIWSLLYEGRILATRIMVGEGPLNDDKIVQNNALLKDLPRPFYSQFVGGPGDDDGVLGWEKPIKLNARNHAGEYFEEIVPCRNLPLEVGYIKSWTTFAHLLRGGVARWPYGSEDIIILVPSPVLFDQENE